MNQRHEGSPLPHLLIRASAGTGKTFQLSNRYLELLRRGVSCDEILATTFTRKAAGEILERVILRLAASAASDDARKELARHTGGGQFGRAACLALLTRTMHRLHRLRVGTLDSFFGQIARSFSLEFGLPPGWEIVDEPADKRLRAQAVEAVLSQGDAARLLTLVNLLAKGEATRGVAQLLRETVDGLYELFLNTEAAAWRCVPHPAPLDAAALAAALETLRTAGIDDRRMQTARDEDYRRALEADWESFLGRGLAGKLAQGEKLFYRKEIPDEIGAIYRPLIEHVRAILVGRIAWQTEATWELLELFHAEYARLKRQHGCLKFEDVTRVLSEPRRPIAAEGLDFRLDSRIDHVLLDEFQDTAPNQWRVIQPLAERVAAGAPGTTSFFCVGDVKQAIYGWRGGKAEIFDAIDRRLPGLQSESLNVSFRSSPAVIDTVNRVFTRIDQHPNLGRAESAVRRWCAQFELHETIHRGRAGYAQLAAAAAAAEGEEQREATLASAADQVASLAGQAPGCGIGVLVRRNDTLARLIYLLRERGVEASEEGGNPLTDSAAVNLILSLLRLADHPGDTVARFHLAHSPLGAWLGLHDHTDAERADALALEVRASLVQHGYGPVIRRWAAQLAPFCSRREGSRLEQLNVLAYAYGPLATLRCDDFLEHVRLTRVSDVLPAQVRVMTIHQSKGLQFDAVVLPELDSELVGQPPAVVVDQPDPIGAVQRVCRYARADVQALLPVEFQRMFAQSADRVAAESLCVLYVALTRAIHAVYAIIAPSKPSEKNLPGTHAGLLRSALAEGASAEPGMVLYADGDEAWFRALPAGAGAERGANAAPRDTQPLRVLLADRGEAVPRRREQTAPSSLEGGSGAAIVSVLRGGKSPALLRGAIFHAWFQQVLWLDDGRPGDAELREMAESLRIRKGAAPPDVDAMLTRFRSMLDCPVVAAALARARYREPAAWDGPASLGAGALDLELRNERGFAIDDEGRLLAGYIDRLVLLQRDGRILAADILDYKTDAISADAAEVQQRTAFYAPQMAAYRRAVAAITGLEPAKIFAHLLFVEPGLLQRVDG